MVYETQSVNSSLSRGAIPSLINRFITRIGKGSQNALQEKGLSDVCDLSDSGFDETPRKGTKISDEIPQIELRFD